MTESPIDVADGTNVLLLGEGEDDEPTVRCCDALLDVGAADRRAEVSVWFPDDVTDRAGFDNGRNGRQPAKRGKITIGDVLRSVDDGPPDFSEPVAADIVENPGDLRSVGTSISRFCEEWSGDDYRIVLCFDSLQDLLEHAEPTVVFQFLHTLLERLDGVDAVAHFHADTGEIDGETVATFASLFDEVVDVDDPGDLVDESGVDDEPLGDPLAEEDDSSGIENGIPAATGSSQATDSDIAERLDGGGAADGDEDESGAEAGRTAPDTQASDDDIADRIPDLDEGDGAGTTE